LENEEAKSRHVDFQCVRSKSITNLDNVDEIEAGGAAAANLQAQVVEEHVDFGAAGGYEPLQLLGHQAGGDGAAGQAIAYLPLPANQESYAPQPSPPPPQVLPLMAPGAGLASAGGAASNIQHQPPSLSSQAFAQQARIFNQNLESSSDDD